MTTRVCCCVLQCRASSENIWNSLDNHDQVFNLLLLTATLLRAQTIAAWAEFLVHNGYMQMATEVHPIITYVNCTVLLWVKYWRQRTQCYHEGLSQQMSGTIVKSSIYSIPELGSGSGDLVDWSCNHAIPCQTLNCGNTSSSSNHYLLFST